MLPQRLMGYVILTVEDLMVRFSQDHDSLWRLIGEVAHRCYTNTQKEWRLMSVLYGQAVARESLSNRCLTVCRASWMPTHDFRRALPTPMGCVRLLFCP